MAYLMSVYVILRVVNGILMVRLWHTQGQTTAYIGSDYGKLKIRILGILKVNLRKYT